MSSPVYTNEQLLPFLGKAMVDDLNGTPDMISAVIDNTEQVVVEHVRTCVEQISSELDNLYYEMAKPRVQMNTDGSTTVESQDPSLRFFFETVIPHDPMIGVKISPLAIMIATIMNTGTDEMMSFRNSQATKILNAQIESILEETVGVEEESDSPEEQFVRQVRKIPEELGSTPVELYEKLEKGDLSCLTWAVLSAQLMNELEDRTLASDERRGYCGRYEPVRVRITGVPYCTYAIETTMYEQGNETDKNYYFQGNPRAKSGEVMERAGEIEVTRIRD